MLVCDWLNNLIINYKQAKTGIYKFSVEENFFHTIRKQSKLHLKVRSLKLEPEFCYSLLIFLFIHGHQRFVAVVFLCGKTFLHAPQKFGLIMKKRSAGFFSGRLPQTFKLIPFLFGGTNSSLKVRKKAG